MNNTIRCYRCGNDRLWYGICRSCGIQVWPWLTLSGVTDYFYLRDGDVIYRKPSQLGALLDVYQEGGWQPARAELFPSERDFETMRQITKANADKVIAATKS